MPYVYANVKVRYGQLPAFYEEMVTVKRAMEANGWKLIGAYSTGMKRRVEIARALMGNPKVLFLDEPTRGLDLPAKREMWKLLQGLAARENVTTFLSSHDAQEIRSLCTQISVISKGRLVYTGSTQDLGADLDSFEKRLIQLLTSVG